MPFIIATSRVYGGVIRKLSQKVQTCLAESNSASTRSFTNIRTVKNFNREGYESANYETLVSFDFLNTYNWAKF